MQRTIMLLLAIASPGHPAHAQVSGYELFAGYCLGVFEQRVNEGPASRPGEEAARQQAQTLGSLYNYLKIKIGPNPSSSHLRALFAFKESGVRDQTECMSAIEANLTTEACERVTQCKPAPDRVASREAPKQPAPIASQPQRQPVPNAPSSQSPSQQRVAPVPLASRPEARPLVAPPPAPARQEALPGAQTRPAGQCMVSRPKPGFQVYLVTCPNSEAMIGRTVDVPTGWTVSKGVNATEAVEFFMKSPYAR